MCASGLVKILFSVGLVLGTGLLVASILTPYWRNFDVEEKKSDVTSGKVKDDYSMGLLNLFCGKTADTNTADLLGKCQENFTAKPTYEQVAIVCLLGSVALCVLCFLWTCVFCFACCCDSCLTPPLPIFSGLATLLSGTAIAVYYFNAKGKDVFDKPISTENFIKGTDFGVSMWLGLAGTAVLAVVTVLGIVLVRIQKSPLGSVI